MWIDGSRCVVVLVKNQQFDAFVRVRLNGADVSNMSTWYASSLCANDGMIDSPVV